MMNKIRLNARLVSSLNTVLFKTAAELMEAAGIASTTWYKVMKEPNAITVQQLLAISNALKIPVRRFFSSGSSDIVGHHDDYVVDNCLPCSYDADSLRAFVESNNRVTWQMAAEATCTTPSHLRNSMLLETRLPVPRFLTACEAFGIDPFSILIDPNPQTSSKGRKPDIGAFGVEMAALRADLASIRAEVEKINGTVMGLQTKCNELLSAYDALARRIGESAPSKIVT